LRSTAPSHYTNRCPVRLALQDRASGPWAARSSAPRRRRPRGAPWPPAAWEVLRAQCVMCVGRTTSTLLSMPTASSYRLRNPGPGRPPRSAKLSSIIPHRCMFTMFHARALVRLATSGRCEELRRCQSVHRRTALPFSVNCGAFIGRPGTVKPNGPSLRFHVLLGREPHI
jgi:hypothetical protein